MNAHADIRAQRRSKAERPRKLEVPPDTEAYFNPTPFEQQFPMEPVIVGRSRWGLDGAWARAVSSVSAIELTLAGNGLLEANHLTHRIQPGDVFILHRGEQHAYRTGAAGHWHKVYVTFYEATVELLFKRLGLDRVTVVHLNPRAVRTVRKLIGLAMNLLRRQPAGFRAEVAAAAYQLILVVTQAATGGAPSPGELPEAIVRMMRQVQDDPGQRLSVEELARQAGYSRSHLERLFHTHLGTGVHQWLIKTRMTRAALFLVLDDAPISEIAARVGYADIYQFSAAFKRSTGLAPRTYRRQRPQPPQPAQTRLSRQ